MQNLIVEAVLLLFSDLYDHHDYWGQGHFSSSNHLLLLQLLCSVIVLYDGSAGCCLYRGSYRGYFHNLFRGGTEKYQSVV